MHQSSKFIAVITILSLFTVLLLAGCTEPQIRGDKGVDDDTNDQNTSSLPDSVAAIVNGEEISMEEVTSLQGVMFQQGQQLTEKQALDSLIGQKLLYQNAEEEGFIPSNEKTEQEIIDLLAAQNGTLEDYKEQLAEKGVSYQEQFNNFKERLAMEYYRDYMLQDVNLSVSDQDVLDKYNELKENDSEGLMPFENVKDQIRSTLEDEKLFNATNALIDDLREDADIRYNDKFE